FQNEIVDLVRFFQTPIRYLNRQLHNYLHITVRFVAEGTKNLDSDIPSKLAATTGNGWSDGPLPPSPNPISHVPQFAVVCGQAINLQSPRGFRQAPQTTSHLLRFETRFLRSGQPILFDSPGPFPYPPPSPPPLFPPP